MATSPFTAVPGLPKGASRHVSCFDTNIDDFLREHGRAVHIPSLPEVSCWVLALHGATATLDLHVYKERLADETSPICDQCRIIGKLAADHWHLHVDECRFRTCICCLAGWQHHPVSRHKYHIIVPVQKGLFVTAHTPEEFAALPVTEGP